MEKGMKKTSENQRRRIDFASLGLFLLGTTFASICILKIDAGSASAIMLIPSVVAATVGALNIIKIEWVPD